MRSFILPKGLALVYTRNYIADLYRQLGHKSIAFANISNRLVSLHNCDVHYFFIYIFFFLFQNTSKTQILHITLHPALQVNARRDRLHPTVSNHLFSHSCRHEISTVQWILSIMSFRNVLLIGNSVFGALIPGTLNL